MTFFDWIWDNAAKLRDLAAIGGVIGTVAGVGVSVWRSRVERLLQKEVNAKRTYAGVLMMSFEHPDYAEPSTPLHEDPATRVRYFWFVSNVLNALDEILVSTPDLVWRETAGLLMKHHVAWLASDEFQKTELPTYSQDLKAIIKSTIDKNKASRSPFP
jgi:hypothetical protein